MRRNIFTGYIIGNRLNFKTFFEPIIDFIEIDINEVKKKKERHQWGYQLFKDLMMKTPPVQDYIGNGDLPPDRIRSALVGNDFKKLYKQGRFEEALALYDRAIAIDSKKATYHCNKSAALISLGRFLQAIVECEEAIRLEPSYGRAHTHLATIYFRLREAEKALNCNETSPCVDSVLAFQAQALQNHLSKCTEAWKVKDWKVILKESQAAISLGADSAPLDAVTTSQQASKLDPSSFEVNAVVRRARAVASARMSGNLLFKASKFTEASAVYNEGLEHDPYNSVLLCNRATCHSKLGQFKKAIEDCNVALIVQPSYSKVRLRRTDYNVKVHP
ncbi:Inactive TPR repeat-containing thioredoxin TTL3 [Glycine max]|nr:Inactive TPR repeat-containing thioredoxin TTL3 [Glycine max]